MTAGNCTSSRTRRTRSAQRLARDGGDTLQVTPQILWKRLKERRLLASVDEKRQTLKIRRTFQRQQHDVLHLHSSALLPATGPDKPDTESDSGASGDVDEGAMSGSMSGRCRVPGTTRHRIRAIPSERRPPMSGLSGPPGGERRPKSKTQASEGEPMSGPVSGGPDDPTSDPTKPDNAGLGAPSGGAPARHSNGTVASMATGYVPAVGSALLRRRWQHDSASRRR